MNTNSGPDRQRARDAYVECAEWTDGDNITDEHDQVVDYTLTDDGIMLMCEDVDAFLNDPEVARDVADMEPEQVGHDFWLTRNHHGAGFWDRGLGELGDRLTKAAHAYGETWLGEYVS